MLIGYSDCLKCLVAIKFAWEELVLINPRSMGSQIDKQVRLGSQRIFPRRSDPKDLWENIRGSGFTLCCIVFLGCIMLCALPCVRLCCCVALYCITACWDTGFVVFYTVLCCVECGHCGSGFSLFCVVCCVVVCSVVLCCLVLGCCSFGFRLFCIVFHCVLLRHRLGFTLFCTVSPWGVRLPEKQLLLSRVVLKFSFYTLNVIRQKGKNPRF